MTQPGTIGIVGGGQLARMLTEAALPLGFTAVVLDPGQNCPAAQVGAKQIIGDLYDAKALQQLADQADYLTVEIEHLDAGVLAKLASAGKPVNPAPTTIVLIQDKLAQKRFLKQHGIPVADFVEITDASSAEQALQKFGGKMLIKTRHGAYDGRGNALVSSAKNLQKALNDFRGKPLYAEQFVPFQQELAVMVARGLKGEVAAYPVVETIHERNICVEVLAPAPVKPETSAAAEQTALDVAQHLEGAGVFGIEMFLTDTGQIFVNEVAPRVHNSGHYTIEACKTSQFEQHIRAITGLPLGPTEMIVPAAVMINILGERDGPVQLEGVEQASSDPHTTVHIYGKSPTKIDRKMGHITSTGKTLQEARERAHKARATISI
jgi:phosphoribosylaminoimidazole carboxylase PurK protein